MGGVNFSRPENPHLTLAFLGEITPVRIADIRKAMDSVALKPMELEFDQVGCFKCEGGDIWWIGIAENKALLDLQKELADSLVAGGAADCKERYWMDWLNDKPFTTLFVTGNHSNYELLRQYSIDEWNGGNVRIAFGLACR